MKGVMYVKINDLSTSMNHDEPVEKQETHNDSENNALNSVLNDVLNGEVKGFSNIGTKKVDNSKQTRENKKKGGKIYSIMNIFRLRVITIA